MGTQNCGYALVWAARRLAAVALLLALGSGCRCWSTVDDPCMEPTTVTVTRVLDGDTFDVQPALELPDGSVLDRVRLLCVDAPELTGGECYGAEAGAWLAERIEGQEVTLHFIVECLGIRGRVLAYVVRGHELLNAELAREGYALPADERYMGYACCDEVEQAILEAQEVGAGGWGVCGQGYPWGQ